MLSGGRQAASWQAYATGARMNARFILVWVKLCVFSWISMTLGLVWYWTGRYFPSLGHRFFVRWFVAWVLTKLSLPLIHPTLPYMGRRYPVEVLYPFLSGRNFYQHSFGEWVLHYAKYGAIAPALITIAAMMLVRRKAPDAHLVRGLQLISSRELDHAIESSNLRGLRGMLARRRRVSRTSAPAIRIADVAIPAELESQHFLVTGKTGSGKSNFIRHMLRQIEARDGIAVVLDPDAEYVSEFYRPQRGDLILNPLDERCPAWSPWSELRPESFGMDAEALAQSLIPDVPNSFAQNGTDRFFRRSGRTTLVSIFETAKPQVPETITQLVALPRDQLKLALKDTPAEALIDPGAHDQGAGIVAMVTNATNPFRSREMERGRMGQNPARLAVPDLNRRFARGGAAAAKRLARLSRASSADDRSRQAKRSGLDRDRRARRARLSGPAGKPCRARAQARSLRGARLPGGLTALFDLWTRPHGDAAVRAGDQTDSAHRRGGDGGVGEPDSGTARSGAAANDDADRTIAVPRRLQPATASDTGARRAARRDSEASGARRLSLHRRLRPGAGGAAMGRAKEIGSGISPSRGISRRQS
jgi:energy-coupling factor transporter ATP-binding protein EcfA2